MMFLCEDNSLLGQILSFVFVSASFVILQAFIFFNNWNMCSTFAEDCLRSPVTVRGCHLNIHFVLEDMHLHSSEVWETRPFILGVKC